MTTEEGPEAWDEVPAAWDEVPAGSLSRPAEEAAPKEAAPKEAAPKEADTDLKALEARARSLGGAADKAQAAYEVLSNEAELDDYYPVEQAHFKAEVRSYRAMRKYAEATGGTAARKAVKHWLAFERSYSDKLAKSKEQERKLRSGKYRWNPTEGIVERVAAAEEVAPTPPVATRRTSGKIKGRVGADPFTGSFGTPDEIAALQAEPGLTDAAMMLQWGSPGRIADAIAAPYKAIEYEAPSDAEALRAYDPGGDENFHDLTGLPRVTEWAAALFGQELAPYPTQTQRALERPLRGTLGPIGTPTGGPISKVFQTHYEEADPGRLSGQTLDNVRQLESQPQVKLYQVLLGRLTTSERSTRKAAAAFSKTELELLDRQKRMEEGTERGTAEEAAFLELAATDVSELRAENNQQYMDFFTAEQTSESDRRAFVDVSNALTQIYAESPEGWDEIVETQKRFDSRITESHPHVGLVLSLIPRSTSPGAFGAARYMNMARNPRLAAEKLPEAYQRLGVALQSASPEQVAGLMQAVGALMDKEEERARKLTKTIEMQRKRISMERSYIADPSPQSYHGDYTMGRNVKRAHEGNIWPWEPVRGESFGVELIKRQEKAAYRDLRRLGVARALLHTLAMAQ